MNDFLLLRCHLLSTSIKEKLLVESTECVNVSKDGMEELAVISWAVL